MLLAEFEILFDQKMQQVCNAHPDPSHDILHVRRVVKNAKQIATTENAELAVVIPAAYLHDVVYVAKTDPRRKEASKLSATKALKFLAMVKYPEAYLTRIAHAIEAHSFSANVSAQSLEAKIVQDADRLDAIGAIGVARCLAFSGLALRSIYNEQDPFCAARTPNDSSNTLDHFFTKLLHLPEKMHTAWARQEALVRLKSMQNYLNALQGEIS